LVWNAIDACEFDEDEGKEYMIRVTTKREGDEAFILQVSDNGSGMDETVRKQIFTSLSSTKGSKGTGLGLLVTQKTVHEHGGTIKVDSEPGKGSTFVIRLPSEPYLRKV
jgi:signal transduction histidine kinase